MRDIAVLIFISLGVILALRRAWWGVLVLAIFSYLNPHAYAWGFVRTLPVYHVLFIVVAFSTFQTKDKQSLPKDWRIPAFMCLWAYFFLTTTQAYAGPLAWQKFWFVSKIYIPFFFTLVLINTREKLYLLIVTIAGSIAIVAVKGGIFALMTGFSYRVYGPPATQFEENNAFAIAVLISVPLLILWYRETSNNLLKKGILAAIPLCYISSLSSWSRGALLTMGVLTVVLLWHSKRKYLAIPVILIGIVFTMQNLPDEWFGRMDTIGSYQEDASAMSRLSTWRDGWNHTLQHPFMGSGFEGWIWVSERDWHSSFVEMFSEHGFIAFGIWISMIIGTLISLGRLPKMTKNIPEMDWVKNYSYMLRASLIAYTVGTAFLGLSYWDLLYHLIFISVLVKKFAIEEMEERSKLLQSTKHNSAIRSEY